MIILIWELRHSLMYLCTKYQSNNLILRYLDLILHFESFLMKGTVGRQVHTTITSYSTLLQESSNTAQTVSNWVNKAINRADSRKNGPFRVFLCLFYYIVC